MFLKPFALFLFLLTIVFSSIAEGQEKINLTTYFPVPYGAYDRLRFGQRSTLPADCEIGTLYVDMSGNLQYCRDDMDADDEGVWTSISPGAWMQTGDNVYPTDVNNPDLFVGIGTTSPQYLFHVQDPVNPQIKMFYDNAKMAFRAGEVSGSQWDDLNIGDNSTALGYNVIAQGTYSVAMGNGARALGQEAVALGDNAFSGALNTSAIASGAIADADYASAIGYNAKASSSGCNLALGSFATANGSEDLAIGTNVQTGGFRSCAIGTGIIDNGDYSLGIGLDDIQRTITQDHVMAVVGGNMGIGTLNPDTFLDIGDDNGANTFCINKGSNSKVDMLEFHTNGLAFSEITGDRDERLIVETVGMHDLHLGTNGQDRLTIKGTDNSGYVGIGTGDPQNTMHIQSDDLGMSSGSLFQGGLVLEGTTSVVELLSKSQGKLGSAVSLAEIGPFGSFQNTWGLFRHSAFGGDGNLRISYGTSPSWGQNPTYLMISRAGWFGIGSKGVDGWFNNPPLHPLELAGGAYCTGTQWVDVSSREFKNNIHPLGLWEAEKTINNLTPVSFHYKVDKADRHLGFIAEDVPDLVASPDRKGLCPMDVTAVLTKIVQDNQRIIEELKAQVRAMQQNDL